VLELAIGTGRVALPLAARGLRVEGVEGSPEMVEKLRAKPGGADLDVVVGDLADVGVEGRFPLVYLVFNTLFTVTDADRQAACFRNVARVLTPGGAFVVEAFVPNPAHFERDEQYPQVGTVTEDEASFRLHRYDRAAQTFVRQRVAFATGGVRLQPFGMRYLWPDQIDRLAARAGLRLEARYADWRRSPFTAASTDHVSVYRA
jgi:SAM-dependent methyltransferase